MIPHNYQPRPYQLPLLKALDSGFKRAVCVWHRRAGKDKTLLNLVVKKMLERVGAYYYFFPTYKQGKKVLWNGIDKTGFKFMSHIPEEIRKRTDNTEMLIELKNGSIFQIVGTDNIDSIVGSNPVGCVFSEYSLQDPTAWGFIRPILEENGGWAVFNYTSRGKNHGYDLLEYAKQHKNWFVQVLPATETDVFSKEQLESEREQYIIEDGDDLRFRQEYLCSFDGYVQGSYYGKFLSDIESKGRITSVPYDPLLTVDTHWDLGIGDAMVVWFTQNIGTEIRVIDYLEANGESVQYFIKELEDRKYKYGVHYWPHDGEVRELITGISRKQTAEKLGLSPILIVEKLSIDDGIHAVRQTLPNCWFDKEKTKRGLECLRQYHKLYDEKRKVYKNHPDHDWSSHGADGFRTFAVGFSQYKGFTSIEKQKKYRIKETKYG